MIKAIFDILNEHTIITLDTLTEIINQQLQQSTAYNKAKVNKLLSLKQFETSLRTRTIYIASKQIKIVFNIRCLESEIEEFVERLKITIKAQNQENRTTQIKQLQAEIVTIITTDFAATNTEFSTITSLATKLNSYYFRRGIIHSVSYLLSTVLTPEFISQNNITIGSYDSIIELIEHCRDQKQSIQLNYIIDLIKNWSLSRPITITALAVRIRHQCELDGISCSVSFLTKQVLTPEFIAQHNISVIKHPRLDKQEQTQLIMFIQSAVVRFLTQSLPQNHSPFHKTWLIRHLVKHGFKSEAYLLNHNVISNEFLAEHFEIVRRRPYIKYIFKVQNNLE